MILKHQVEKDPIDQKALYNQWCGAQVNDDASNLQKYKHQYPTVNPIQSNPYEQTLYYCIMDGLLHFPWLLGALISNDPAEELEPGSIRTLGIVWKSDENKSFK